MPKRATALELALAPPEDDVRNSRWLYTALRREILNGRLRAGARLPATRDLAGQYRLARGTVVNAFDQLKAEGYIEGTVGSGTYVSKVLPDALFDAPRPAANATHEARRSQPRVSEFGRRVRLFSGLRPGSIRAFRANQPALDLFPTTLWTQITARRLRRASSSLFLGCEPFGYAPLREAIAHYLTTSRSVNCTPAQVAVISGAQEALDLSARVLLDPGDTVCMENPGYSGARLVFDAVGAKVVPVPLDAEGMQVRACDLRRARLIYVTPGHQFPLGTTMTLARRLQLLEAAQQSGAVIFEDDYDSEYRYAGRPVPSLQGLDRRGVVLFSGSFSKVLFPSLRLAYIVVPPPLVDSFAAAISMTTRHAPLLDQAVLCDFIADGHFARHLRRMRQIYAERWSVLVESAREHARGLLEIAGIEAGLQTAGWLARGLDAEAVTTAAAARGVEVRPLSRFAIKPLVREGLQLGFAAVDARELRRGMRELSVVLAAERKRKKPRSLEPGARSLEPGAWSLEPKA